MIYILSVLFTFNVSRLFRIVCAHKSFCLYLGMNYTKQLEKHGSGLVNSVKWPFTEMWHYIRAYYVLYII